MVYLLNWKVTCTKCTYSSLADVTCYLQCNCKLFHCHKFFPTWSSQYFTILMSPKMRKRQTMPESRACKPVCFSMSSNSFWSKIRTKSPCGCNFFSKFQWKNSPQKSRRNHPRMERKRPFFLSPSHLHRTSSPDQVRELERKPPLHRLGVDSMQVGPNFRLQTLRSLMKSWYIPFNCPKHAFFRGCFTWMINQPFTWKNGSTLGFQVITTVLIPYKSTPINHL